MDQQYYQSQGQSSSQLRPVTGRESEQEHDDDHHDGDDRDDSDDSSSSTNSSSSIRVRDTNQNKKYKRHQHDPKKPIGLKFPFHFASHHPRHKQRKDWRYKLGEFLESSTVQTAIVILTLLDLVITITEIFLEEAYKKCNDHHPPHSVEAAENVFKYMTIALLSIFALEILLLLVSFGRDFFYHPLYVLDGVVITVSLVVEIVFRERVASMLVVFRLWRMVRIGHAVAFSVESHEENKYKDLKRKYKRLKKKQAANAKM
ncbi:hypothetical protein SAMD00019534_044270 [Acytostelium subglobosum LB1]|uniref:hypothetical protein n=1 Tax=Acytostelium subglobosum LB1 TaxID=1410327 RepID=UPI000644F684|nr:hypothetical protein SAMD00019534_044270 [Acytostelium subglobosum LB1]GAM21252.1 hypothetical protein SAMD00019534_044270 [Acytostelium subglobosum LB1]|eukprot:XP_012755371.1 hypothetical protein SAMD00019534_044270 [Acytostelium subglobosum LB1]